MNQPLSEQELLRRASLESLRGLGVEPYPSASFERTHRTAQVLSDFSDEDSAAWQEVSLAGRLMSRRIMGKASFAELQDASGRLQLYISRDEICPGENKDAYNDVFKKHCDIGDWVGVKGFIFRTQVGENNASCKKLFFLGQVLASVAGCQTGR
ncbi:MAG: hypothetical protein RIT39_359 [Bacteroidota bacterium]